MAFVAGVIQTIADCIRKINPNANLPEKDDLDADISNWLPAELGGSSTPRQLLDLKQSIAKLDRNQHSFMVEMKGWKFNSEYNGMKNLFENIKTTYENYVKFPDKRTWEEFESCCKAQITSSSMNLNWFYKWITETCNSCNTLLKDLTIICNMDHEKFRPWQLQVVNIFSQMCIIRTAYFYYTIFSGELYPDANGSTDTSIITASVEEELNSMKERIRTITDTMEQLYHQLRFGFLLKKCGDPRHKQCGAEGDKDCSELTAIAYSTAYNAVSKNPPISNQAMAEETADKLRTLYPHLLWSVVVSEDYKHVELQVNPEHISNIWLQRFGTVPKAGFFTTRENIILSDKYGSYGYLHCYVRQNITAKIALVFWADKETLKDEKMKTAHSRLEEGKTALNKSSTSEGWNIFRIMGKLNKKEMNCLMAVGLQEQSNSGEIIGLAIAEYQNGTFPVHMGDLHHCVLIWPEPSDDQSTMEFKLVKEKLTMLGGGRIHVFKGRKQLLNGLPGEFVAIKAVPLAIGEDKQFQRNLQIANLNWKLGLFKKFDHPNIVKHLGFQVYSPEDNKSNFCYHIITNYCQGGTLSDKVKEDVTLNQIVFYANSILQGIAYLHEYGRVHKAIHGDNIMFEYPKGLGNIKIISIARTDELLKSANSSFVPSHPIMSVFEAPELQQNVHTRKSDIWSFGCVFLQMILGRPPDYDKSSKMPMIKYGLKIPKVLEETVMDNCLSLDFNNRPSAASLLTLKIFSQEYNIIWRCPARPRDK